MAGQLRELMRRCFMQSGRIGSMGEIKGRLDGTYEQQAADLREWLDLKPNQSFADIKIDEEQPVSELSMPSVRRDTPPIRRSSHGSMRPVKSTPFPLTNGSERSVRDSGWRNFSARVLCFCSERTPIHWPCFRNVSRLRSR